MNITILSSRPMSAIAKHVTKRLKGNASLRKEGYVYEHVDLDSKTFSSGDILPKIPETVRSKRIYLLHSPALPDLGLPLDPNKGLMELILTINAIKLAWARDIVLVVPFIPYFRQDRKEDYERVPISARAVADMLTMSGIVKGIITMDLHVEQEQGFFSCPTQNLSGRVILAEHFKKMFKGDFSNVVVSSTDLGGGKRAQRLAQMLDPGMPVGTLLKGRREDSTVKTLGFIGPDITGKTVILSDDMIDTGNSTITGIKSLLDKGAEKVIACASHGIFSRKNNEDPRGGLCAPSEEKFREAGAEVIALDTIPRSDTYREENKDWLTVLSTADYLAKVICESHRAGGSVSALS